MHKTVETKPPIRIVHISTGLNPSGAEYSLLTVLKNLHTQNYEFLIISLIGHGIVGNEIEKLGIRVVYLDMPRRIITLSGIIRMIREINKFRPDIIQGWMYHGSLAAAFAKMIARNAMVIWNVRRMPVTQGSSFSPLILAKTVKSIPALIIYNSRSSASAHEELGFPHEKTKVIYNGFDGSRFQPNPEMRDAVRHELGIEEDSLVIGMVGRYTPEKNHLLFADAAQLILAQYKNVHFVFIGEQMTIDNQEFVHAVRKNNIFEQTHLLGRREDLHHLMTAFDLLVLPSSTEGFPNVVGEAMACGVPCVVSDVSDNRLIVDKTGVVIDTLDAHAIAESCIKLLRLSREERVQLGENARQRIIDQFSLETMISIYSNIYNSF